VVPGVGCSDGDTGVARVSEPEDQADAGVFDG